MMQKITTSDLILRAAIKIKSILYIKIEHKFNHHASAYIEAVLDDDEKAEDVYSMNESTAITIENKNNNNILFCGLPIKIEFISDREIRKVCIHLRSASLKLDIAKKSRSFQDVKALYADIFEQIIVKEYSGDIINTKYKTASQEHFIVQYEETDWSFILRLASQLHAVVLADATSKDVKIWIGPPQGSDFVEEANNYKLSRNLEDVLYTTAKGNTKSELNLTYCTISTANEYEIGDNITHRNVKFKVAEKVTELQNELIVFTYTLCREDGIFSNTIYNTAFAGLSVLGKILAVKKDKLKLHLSIDEKQNEAECIWFPISTPYAAVGNTGMYCMPQVGDYVKLYFHTMDEAKALVKTLIRTDGKDNPKTKDAANKYWGTKDKMEMTLQPTQMNFTAVPNKVDLSMKNISGVAINGTPAIMISAGGSLKLEAKSINFVAEDTIVVLTPKANIIVDQVMHFKA